jgi:hypothetical protein
MFHLYFGMMSIFSRINAIETCVWYALYIVGAAKTIKKGRRWQWPVVQYELIPPEVALIISRTRMYGWKGFLWQRISSQMEAIIYSLTHYE